MANLQADWENREFIQNVQYNIMRVATFLNQFDISTRIRLANLNEKLTQVERQMEYLEAAVKGVGKSNDANSPTKR